MKLFFSATIGGLKKTALFRMVLMMAQVPRNYDSSHLGILTPRARAIFVRL